MKKKQINEATLKKTTVSKDKSKDRSKEKAKISSNQGNSETVIKR
jgi:hypothetical protein